MIVLLIFRDYGATRGFTNESEFTVVKVDFYNDIKKYLAELDNTDIRSLEDIVKCVKCLLKHTKTAIFPSLARVLADIPSFFFLCFSRYNNDNEGTEGGTTSIHPAFASGQDLFLASLETKGKVLTISYILHI